MVTEDCIAKRERVRGAGGGREGRLLSQECSSVAVKQPNASVYRSLFRKKLNGFRLIASHFRRVRKIAKSDC